MGVHEPSSEPAAAKLGDGGKKIKNTLLWIDKDGMLKHRYQKLHLFDVEIEGGPIQRESEYVKKIPFELINQSTFLVLKWKYEPTSNAFSHQVSGSGYRNPPSISHATGAHRSPDLLRPPFSRTFTGA